MARRGKDLFELLAARQGHSGKSAPRRRDAPDVFAWARRAKQGLSSVFPRSSGGSKPRAGKAAKARRASRSASAGPQISVPGIWASAMVLGALGVGFVVGRGTASAHAAPEGLEVGRVAATPQDSPAVAALKPGLLPGGGGARWEPPDLSQEKEVESLSTNFYVVLTYPESDKERASRLAHHLRENGLADARIKLFPTDEDGFFRWAVLLYVPNVDDGPRLLETMQSIPPPAFEPRFAARLSGSFPLMKLEGSSEGR